MDILKEIDAYFTSGNSIPVSRATIKHEEWMAAKALIESLRNQLSTNTWISVEDSLPELLERGNWDESKRCVVIVNKGRESYEAFARLTKFKDEIASWNIEGHTGRWHDYITHWMPLPPAPTHKER